MLVRMQPSTVEWDLFVAKKEGLVACLGFVSLQKLWYAATKINMGRIDTRSIVQGELYYGNLLVVD